MRYICFACGAYIENRETVVSVSLHRARRSAARQKSVQWVLLPEEFEAGVHDVMLHEACFFRRMTSIVEDLYEETVPDEPARKRPDL